MNMEEAEALAVEKGTSIPVTKKEEWQSEAERLALAAALLAMAGLLDKVIQSSVDATLSGIDYETWKVSMAMSIDQGIKEDFIIKGTVDEIKSLVKEQGTLVVEQGTLLKKPVLPINNDVIPSLTPVTGEGVTPISSTSHSQLTLAIPSMALTPSKVSLIRVAMMQFALNKGRYEFQIQNKANKQILLYDAVNDDRTRDAHRAMSGFMAGIDDPIWATWYPPNGYNCRCKVIAMSIQQAFDRGFRTGMMPPNVMPDAGFDGSITEDVDAFALRLIKKSSSILSPVMSNALSSAWNSQK